MRGHQKYVTPYTEFGNLDEMNQLLKKHKLSHLTHMITADDMVVFIETPKNLQEKLLKQDHKI